VFGNRAGHHELKRLPQAAPVTQDLAQSIDLLDDHVGVFRRQGRHLEKIVFLGRLAHFNPICITFDIHHPLEGYCCRQSAAVKKQTFVGDNQIARSYLVNVIQYLMIVRQASNPVIIFLSYGKSICE
jgi:hypothetical protein